MLSSDRLYRHETVQLKKFSALGRFAAFSSHSPHATATPAADDHGLQFPNQKLK